MKTIGLIGGLSWESSIEYYRLINQAVQAQLGGSHSAKCLMYSFDFAEIEKLQYENRWDEAANMMIEAGLNLKRGGADFIIICSNTMHRMAEVVEQQTGLPILHIADTTAHQIQNAGYKKVGLLATIFTMEQDFYRGRLKEKWHLEVLVPPAEERQSINRIIYDELVQGIVKAESRQVYREVMAHLVAAGAEAIILGCTEIMLLVKPEDSAVPQFDTTALHAKAAVDFALNEGV